MTYLINICRCSTFSLPPILMWAQYFAVIRHGVGAQIAVSRFCVSSFRNFCQLVDDDAVYKTTCRIIEIHFKTYWKWIAKKLWNTFWKFKSYVGFSSIQDSILSIRARDSCGNALLCYHCPIFWVGGPGGRSVYRKAEICGDRYIRFLVEICGYLWR